MSNTEMKIYFDAWAAEYITSVINPQIVEGTIKGISSLANGSPF